MNEQKTLDYARIAQAIGYIRENFTKRETRPAKRHGNIPL